MRKDSRCSGTSSGTNDFQYLQPVNEKKTYPRLDLDKNSCESPHVVVLGAGASLAALPAGDLNGRRLPLMDNLVEVVGLGSILERHGIRVIEPNFELLYNRLATSARYTEALKEIENEIEEYFRKLVLPDKPNLYDKLILCFREKDVIATFNWDPLLAQAYQRNLSAVGFEQMPQIVFLHGNVATGLCRNCRTYGWRHNLCDQCGERFSPTPLLYPIEKKNYSKDEFIHEQWEILRSHLKHAYCFTVFGYSAPASDVEARKLMHEMWKQNTTTDFSQMSIIDIKPEPEVAASWKEFFIRHNYGIRTSFCGSYITHHPRRTCDALAMATLQQRPWPENRLPQFETLEDMQSWLTTLVDEEKSGKLSGKPC